MKIFIAIFLVFLMLSYGEQVIAETKCNRANAIDTSTIRTLRNSYEKQLVDLKIDSLTKRWEQTAKIIFVIGIFLTICGATIACLQAYDSRKIKISVAILGICVALLNLYREGLPDGTYKNYQKAIQDADNIKIDLQSYFRETEKDTLNPEEFKKTIVSICENVDTLKTLKSNYSTNLPFPLDWLVNTANAAPAWWSDDSVVGIKVSGSGSSRIEAKDSAEKQGLLKIQTVIQDQIASQLKEPIYSTLKQEVNDAAMLAVQKDSESFEGSNPVTYWILYQIDNSLLENILKGISFPLVIFNTNVIDSKIRVLRENLSDYGFKVSEQPAPRGLSSETNAIFVGSGVPIDAIKKTAELLIEADIPIKAIIYPWSFQKSKLEEKQRFNLVQIGGTKMLESSPILLKASLDKLHAITTQNEMLAFCKEDTEALKKEWGLK